MVGEHLVVGRVLVRPRHRVAEVDRWFFGVNPATVMSTVFVAASADGTERTSSAARRGGSRRIGKHFGLRAILLLPFRRTRPRSLHSPNMRALITGGTGKLGSAITARLEQEGWQVFAAGSKDGDLSQAGPARALVERAVEELGGLDVLVNAAGAGFEPKPVEEVTEEDWTRPWARLRRAVSSSPRQPHRIFERAEAL